VAALSVNIQLDPDAVWGLLHSPVVSRGTFFLLLVLLAGCADPGDEWWAGWQTYDTAIGGYQFRYLAPPFERQEDVPAGQCHLTVESTHDNNLPPGLPELPPSYEVFTQPLPPGATDGYAAAKLAELMGTFGHVQKYPVAPLESRSGLVGHDVSTEDVYVRYHRYVYFALPTGLVLEARIETNDDPEQQDVEDLVASFAAH